MVKTHSLEVLLDLHVDLMLKFFPEPQNNIEMYTKKVSSIFMTKVSLLKVGPKLFPIMKNIMMDTKNKVTISLLKVVLGVLQRQHPVFVFYFS